MSQQVESKDNNYNEGDDQRLVFRNELEIKVHFFRVFDDNRIDTPDKHKSQNGQSIEPRVESPNFAPHKLLEGIGQIQGYINRGKT